MCGLLDVPGRLRHGRLRRPDDPADEHDKQAGSVGQQFVPGHVAAADGEPSYRRSGRCTSTGYVQHLDSGVSRPIPRGTNAQYRRLMEDVAGWDLSIELRK